MQAAIEREVCARGILLDSPVIVRMNAFGDEPDALVAQELAAVERVSSRSQEPRSLTR